jgi:hypothetical protein
MSTVFIIEEYKEAGKWGGMEVDSCQLSVTEGGEWVTDCFAPIASGLAMTGTPGDGKFFNQMQTTPPWSEFTSPQYYVIITRKINNKD